MEEPAKKEGRLAWWEHLLPGLLGDGAAGGSGRCQLCIKRDNQVLVQLAGLQEPTILRVT